MGGKSQWRRPRRRGFDPWVRKAPWRRKWQPTPVFLPGESHRERNLVGYSPQGHKESNMTGRTKYAQVSTLRLRKKKMSSASVMCLWPIHVTQPGTFPPDLAHNLCHTRTLRYQQHESAGNRHLLGREPSVRKG